VSADRPLRSPAAFLGGYPEKVSNLRGPPGSLLGCYPPRRPPKRWRGLSLPHSQRRATRYTATTKTTTPPTNRAAYETNPTARPTPLSLMGG
jgi:hypothetical protein